MDGEAKLPAPLVPAALTTNNLVRPINPVSNFSRPFNTSTTSSSSSSSPDFLRNVQAAFKRHRPLGLMQSNSIRPRRLLAPQRETSKSSDLNKGSVADTKKNQDGFVPSQRLRDSISQTKSMISVLAETQEDASVTPPSMSGSILSTREENFKPFDVQRVQPRYTTGVQNNDTVSSALVEPENAPLVDGQKKVHFALENNAISHGADDEMATELDNLMSHISSLALTEMEWDVSNPAEASVVNGQDVNRQSFQNLEVDVSYGGISSLMGKKATGIQDQLHKFGNFLQSDCSHPMTQSSVVGSSCATTTLINSASAPMLNSTTYCSNPHQNSSSCVGLESVGDCDLNSQLMTHRDMVIPSHLSLNQTGGMLADQRATASQAPDSVLGSQLDVKDYDILKGKQSNVLNESDISKDPPPLDDKSTKGNTLEGDITDVKSQAPVSKNPSLDVKLEPSKSDKQENVASGKAPRKRTYDPELFFKVNGKLYQRLGKIGSGGSSEVHKVISSDCTIYALKRIKLKGRDYATAYGFCQEIQYLNKLKGKSYIIQLIDYEVTDKALLKEVMNGSMSNKEGRFKEDGYIYMVLEYGEIDLAHMLSHKWKELDSSKTTIDENWLRFYWQQMLLAVNTIHEERIVHSDLKPANFLLVRGSLKLIDFGIAKAIMSDTTNIQRDSQVGTLSYMSPEAFLCNELDANGNTIKCGRPSDIWSLGCILYQMVYGRTPFSEYKTFWAKFKVITDPNHEITFEPLPNPWLLDLMKKCLAWHRNERWRIPELLTHPFLVPPAPHPQDDKCRLLHLIAESCGNDPKALKLCCELQELLRDPRPDITSQALVSVDQRCKLLREISNLCVQLEEQLATSERVDEEL